MNLDFLGLSYMCALDLLFVCRFNSVHQMITVFVCVCCQGLEEQIEDKGQFDGFKDLGFLVGGYVLSY